ncbi:tetratricopeptide repeat protein [Chitinophaga skermanii]|uniref:histidine kinase n=1 Tax=Chitinophaga skermanii TaxID=331697 RepID=A0A327R2A3_9BACT|nr:sensor histidine kinase [Chitinophaga skermanii]RAJ10761.1 tetratricopeptide repeat protein [Chitinophaga skermanii]
MRKINNRALWGFVFSLLCGFIFNHASARPPYAWQNDSLRSIMASSQQDSNTVIAYYKYANQFVYNAPDSAIFFLSKGKTLAKKLGFKKGEGIWASYYIDVLNNKGAFQEALAVAEDALSIFLSLHDEQQAIVAYNNVGNEHQKLGNLQAAVENYLKAIALSDKLKDRPHARILYNNVASVFLSLDEYDKSLLYAKKGYEVAVQLKDTFGLASSLVNVGFAQARTGQTTQAVLTFRNVVTLGHILDDNTLVLDGLINIASIEADMLQRLDVAQQIYGKILAITDTFPSAEHRLYGLLGTGQTLHKLKRYREADQYIMESIALAKKMHASYELKDAFLTASENKEALAEPLAALGFRKEYEQVKDSLLSIDTRQNVHQLEIQYATARKDKDLAQKQLELTKMDLQIQAKNKWLTIALLALSFLVIIAIIIVGKFRDRQRLHLEKLQTIRKQREVQVLEAIVQGEERERSRISKDLHDGVGGLLSAVKMHFSAVKHEMPLLKSVGGYTHAMRLLDEAVQEIRKTAHNLMPETLSRYGLTEALHRFCKNVSHGQTLQITFFAANNLVRFNPNFELSIYRVVQELVNNIVKHAHASQALVQLSLHGSLLSITVEDDGIGYEDDAAKNGMGLQSLQARMKALQGSVVVETALGVGTTVHIEFDIDKLEGWVFVPSSQLN